METQNAIEKYGNLDSIKQHNCVFRIKLSDKLELIQATRSGLSCKYWLKVKDGTITKKICEDAYLKTENYFYYQYVTHPYLIKYVSRSIGGAILFKGKGRWSGNPSSLSEDIGGDLIDCSVDSLGGFAYKSEYLKEEINKNMPDLKYSFERSWVKIDFEENQELLNNLIENL